MLEGKPIVMSLAEDWGLPNHFAPIKDYGKVRATTTYVIFGFRCEKCEAEFRSDYRNCTQFDASVAGLRAWADQHRHVEAIPMLVEIE